MAPIYREKFQLTDLHVDRYGRLKPATLLYFVQEMAGRHSDLLRVDWDTLASHNLFWAVTRHRVQISRLPVRGETITVETWPMPTTKVAYPRSVVAYDEDGQEVFRAISIWVLVDTQTRSMVLPGKSGILVDGTVRGNELSVPRPITPSTLANTVSRTVHYTQLDRNGHMNNTRYMDWIEDLLPSEFHHQNPVREFTVCYHNEAMEGQTVNLSWNLSEEPILLVDAYRNKEDMSTIQERVFSAKIEY